MTMRVHFKLVVFHFKDSQILVVHVCSCSFLEYCSVCLNMFCSRLNYDGNKLCYYDFLVYVFKPRGPNTAAKQFTFYAGLGVFSVGRPVLTAVSFN